MIENTLNKVVAHSYGVANTGNVIIHGNNTEVLPMLHKKYKGKIKCVYIDPPYNNGESYLHYNDKKNHQDWISNITKTLELIYPLISDDGSIWISIDDSEMHYLKVA
ncbi:MAG: DNA methyltransferase, partial [Bacteroidia bacterium]